MTKSTVWQRSRCWRWQGRLRNWEARVQTGSPVGTLTSSRNMAEVRCEGIVWVRRQSSQGSRGSVPAASGCQQHSTSESSHFYRNVWTLLQGMRSGLFPPFILGVWAAEEYLRELQKKWYPLGRAEFQLRPGDRGSPGGRCKQRQQKWPGMKGEASTWVCLGHGL